MSSISSDRYNFPIDLNKIVSEPMILPLLDRIPQSIIDKLNHIVTGIKFMVGGEQ